MERLSECRAKLLADKPTGRNKSYYEHYFDVRRTPKRGLRVTLREKAVDEYIKGQSGFWILYTNAEKDPAEALHLYRRRNDIELLFDDLKNASDSRRLRVPSDAVMQGRLFVSFLALVAVTRLKGMVKAILAKERSHWNWKEILIKVNTYSRTRYKGRYKDVYSCPTKAQRTIFDLPCRASSTTTRTRSSMRTRPSMSMRMRRPSYKRTGKLGYKNTYSHYISVKYGEIWSNNSSKIRSW
jgi:hypothetical protein